MIFILPSDYFGNFFSSLNYSFEYLYSYFQLFLSFLLSYPITYYAFFMLLFIPAFYFLVDWLQDFISDGMGKNSIGRHNPLPPNVYAKEKEGIRGFNRFIRSSRSKRIKEMEMKRGRIYKTKTLVYKGKKYRYVTSERAPEDFQGNFKTDE